MSVYVTRHSKSKRRSLAEDRRFFDKHPDRCHRLRLATDEEIQAALHEFGADALQLNAGSALYALVRRVRPRQFVRIFLPNVVDLPVDVPELLCALLYEIKIKSGIAGREKLINFLSDRKGLAS